MFLFRRTRTAAICAAASAALVLGMAGSAVAFSTRGWTGDGLVLLHNSSAVPTTPRTARTPEPPAVPTAAVVTAATPAP